MSKVGLEALNLIHDDHAVSRKTVRDRAAGAWSKHLGKLQRCPREAGGAAVVAVVDQWQNQSA